ncbi:MAG: twin-arginine translocase subunit TatC [Chloroflexi bacterium]|nr:twin-arginine translocase subunit TatC [Chloroflexota bacterium]
MADETLTQNTSASDRELPLLEHLLELRTRLIRSAIALAVGTAISIAFAKQGLELLLVPLPFPPQTLGPAEAYLVYFRVALIGGAVLAMPMIVYQVVAFLLPGMLPNERRYLLTSLPGVALFFAGGVAFATLIMLPAAIGFMSTFLSDIVEQQWTLDNYISFVTRMMFWMGMVFQTPLLLFILAKLDLVTARQLSRFRKYAVLVCAIVAAVVTPTPDPVNMMIVMVPLYILYEFGVILARIARIGRPDEGVSPRANR